MNQASHVWHNGQFKPWEEATVHVSAHALHYGSSVFEGERVYATPNGPAFFRLAEQTARLFESARMYEIDIGYSEEEINTACLELIALNRMKSAYVRPIVFRGAGGLGVVPDHGSPVDVSIMALDWGAYLGEAIEHGADVCVSSWNRPAPNTTPTWAKAGGNYLSSQLIGFEARRGGYHEGIALGTNGLLSEGAGENLFVVRKGRLLTPTTSAGILAGITRDTVITLARDLAARSRSDLRVRPWHLRQVFAPEPRPRSRRCVRSRQTGRHRQAGPDDTRCKAFSACSMALRIHNWLSFVPSGFNARYGQMHVRSEAVA
jgi:branched-chain amino acid aminotransferase